MITRIIVPDVGATGADVRMISWLANEGDSVAAGAPLFVLESDKATHEIEAYRAGYLRKVLAPVDAQVEIGRVVALLSDEPDEPLDEPVAQQAHSPSGGALDGRQASTVPNPSAPLPKASPEHGRILASPLAKKLAHEHRLDLAAVPGSGPEGQVHKRDVLNALAVGAASNGFVASLPNRRVPLSRMRRAIARRTQYSKAEVPHFYAEVTIDLTDALARRDRLREQAKRDGRAAPTVNDLVVLAAAQALRQTPELNASFGGEEIHYFEEATVGVAVALQEGVIVPVVRAADRYGLWSLAAATAALRARGQAGQLTADDLVGGALTVSNLGMHGLDRFIAVINPPQAAVLAIGAARPRPAVYQGQLAIRTLLDATLSLDHRVADGVAAARFLQELRHRLEEPSLLPADNPAEVNA